MPFEIEMLSVGAADSMIIRYFNQQGEEIVILIDAGNRKDGPKIVRHINKWTNQKYIDLAICTHPDADHIGGFFHVVEHVKITEFWIHDPSKHKTAVRQMQQKINLSETLKKGFKNVLENLDHSFSLLSLIDSKGIRRDREPFAGLQYELAPLLVVGPSVSYYESLLCRFRDVNILFEEENDLEKSLQGGQLLSESLTTKQVLDMDNDRSKENNSSAIILFKPNSRKYLFTSDAGPDGLQKAHDKYDLSNLDWLDVPHHGSRYNLSTSLIKTFNPKRAYISCDGSTHYPNTAVVEELKNIDCTVFSTGRSGNILHKKNLPLRLGYSKSTPL